MAPKRSRLPLVIGVVVVVAALGVGAFLYFTRDTSDPKLKLSDSPSAAGQSVDAPTLDGTWKVVAGTDADATVAGYRVEEVFAQGARKATANGRTNDVTGSLTVADGTVTAGSFTVDLTTLKSDEDRRDQVIRDDGLETNRFPKGTFTLTKPIKLPQVADGKVFNVFGTGDLTLHGVTRAVVVPLHAKVTGKTVTVQGLVPVHLSDHEITPPSRAGFVEVSGDGGFEFLISLQK